MRQEEREALRQRYQFRCGYCGVREGDVGAELTVDHFQPRSQGGPDTPENWVYCCHACNEFKGNYWQPDSSCRILHPLQEDLAAHAIEEDDGTLRALSETGAFHIAQLHLNRCQLIAHRSQRRRLDVARYSEARLLDHLRAVEEQVQELIAELNRLKQGDSTP